MYSITGAAYYHTWFQLGLELGFRPGEGPGLDRWDCSENSDGRADGYSSLILVFFSLLLRDGQDIDRQEAEDKTRQDWHKCGFVSKSSENKDRSEFFP